MPMKSATYMFCGDNLVMREVKNVTLIGNEAIKADKITTTYKGTSKKIIDEAFEQLYLPLKEVTEKEIVKYRRKHISSFVLKRDGRFYYARIPNYIRFIAKDIVGTHKCVNVTCGCNRFSAKSDEKGGCAKVRDGCSGIEKYPWITLGYESFNTKFDSFIVASCLNYEEFRYKRENCIE